MSTVCNPAVVSIRNTTTLMLLAWWQGDLCSSGVR